MWGCIVVLFYIRTNKTSAPVSVGGNQDQSCWCTAKKFKRSAVRARHCASDNYSFRREQACISSYKLSLPKTVFPEKD